MPYIANSDRDRQAMLDRIGAASIDELLAGIPASNRLTEELAVSPALSESELVRHVHELAAANLVPAPQNCFLGGGAYISYIPETVRVLATRSEFITAYTPYQAEVSQGTLQVIYEFQSMIQRLTGMEIANASLYDGGSALAEGLRMARAIHEDQPGRKRILLSDGLFRKHLQVARTYGSPWPHSLETIALENGRLNPGALSERLDDTVCAVVIQSPNAFGSVEDLKELTARCHAAGALVIHVFDPLAQALFTSSGEADVDIAVGEGQSISQPPQYGGPNLGLFASRARWVRLMPGRLIGSTEDATGKRGYVLTFQTREQHIRRAKATSNICTNQALVATFATIYLSLMGGSGLRQLARSLYTRATWLAERLERIPGCRVLSAAPFFREFALELPGRDRVLEELKRQGVLAGLALDSRRGSNALLVAVNEFQTQDDLENFARLIERATGGGAR
ncbi:MAG: aminomethyl-transferring glycine dehydrogenase subunit GcvPA [Calditrichaeota bacterium]|nr:aminomethyl-transferring glycine dehydrogenase subunit GcvPA [Calditrichota bacterium]